MISRVQSRCTGTVICEERGMGTRTDEYLSEKRRDVARTELMLHELKMMIDSSFCAEFQRINPSTTVGEKPPGEREPQPTYNDLVFPSRPEVGKLQPVRQIQPSICVNKVLLAHSHAPSLAGHPWLLPGNNGGRRLTMAAST